MADADGLDTFSMRRLAQRLEVDPMSLYHWVRDKRDLLAAMVDALVAEIPAPRRPDPPAAEWRDQMRDVIAHARTLMTAHPWAKSVIAGQDAPTPAVIAHIDRVLGIMRAGGLSVALAHHALHVLGSRILGFSQDLFDDTGDAPDDATAAAQSSAFAAMGLPNVAELAGTASHEGGMGGCDGDDEFAFSLDLMLDGLERARLRG